MREQQYTILASDLPDSASGSAAGGGTRAESERRFREMIDALPAAIYTTDAEGRLTHFNPAAVEFSGRVPELGTDRWCVTLKLYHPDGTPMPHEECPMALALKEGRSIRGAEALAERPDGRRIWFEAYPTPLRDEEGRVVGGINMLIDVTERKRAAAALRESEAQLEEELVDAKLLQGISAQLIHEEDIEALYEKILDAAVAIMHSDHASMQMLHPERGSGGELHLLTFRGLNPGAVEFWEWVGIDSASTCGEALRTGQRVVVPDIERCESMTGTDDLATCLQTGIRAVQTTPLVSRGGRVLGMISTHWSQPHQPSERDLRLLDILARQAADLLEHRLAQEQERRSLEEAEAARAEAEQANLVKSQFLATMSHELRTPLNAILGYADLLDAEIAGPLTEGQRKQLDRIDTSARHLLQIIEEILTFSRVEAGREEVQAETIDLAELVRGTAALLEPLATAKRLGFSCRAPERLRVETDPGKVRQILLNLLSNAVKFTDRGEVRLEVRVDGGEVLLRVRDTGIGIPTEHRERIFEPFSQVEQTASRRAGGTGLGLTVTAQLVRLLGGDLSVESTLGQGSTFTVRLPLRRDGHAPGE